MSSTIFQIVYRIQRSEDSTMEMTLQLLLVVVSLMTIPHVEAAGSEGLEA